MDTKIALITGANKGIGFEISRQLCQKNFHVIVSARNREAGLEAVSRLQKTGGQADFLELDVADSGSIEKAALELKSKIDHLDVLVNNAGIFPDEKRPITQMDETLFKKALWTNTLGPVRVTQAFLPFLEKSKNGGRIINLSSGLGQLSSMEDYAPSYSVSKTALNAVTRQFASLLEEKKIVVNSVCPGWVKTDMGGANAERSVEQGADTVVWLASEAPEDINGKFLRDRKEIPW
jgi:NAD(P)-dependent dehydrogenase (short-subunit alcohol dehydrogenase family)